MISLFRFAEAMDCELENNSHKSGWDQCSDKWLLNRLRQEVRELARAIEEKKSADSILSEAADVANFAYFLAYNYDIRSRQEGA